MTEDEFWKIVDSALIDPSTPYFLEEHYLSYWNALDALPDVKLSQFVLMHEQVKQAALENSPMLAAFLLHQRFSDAEIQNFLAGLISRGRDVFGRFLRSPDEAWLTIDRPNLLVRCEAFGYAPVAISKEKGQS
ncbi:MAG: DUF4240 domain-containing protein [Candidatus Obscuribacterales bacterium]|jgi:hypothetical protein